LAKNPVKYAHAPTVRCAPSTFNSFVDHVTLWQRRRIKDMGFGGLLCVAAEMLESRELLKFLFDRLDPKTMVLNVAKDKGIHVTPFVVKQVLDLPEGGEDIVLSTHIQASKALSTFKTLLGLQESHDLHASHLQKTLKDDLELGSGMITDDMAIRFFFIIACNKLLFPSTDNNIRCKDVYLTRDLSCLSALNRCKAVVDDLREAALNWQSDKAKKSFSGCAILLIILYLDNLQCQHQLVTDFEMKQFTRFKRPIIVPCMHTDDNDCGFYAIKSMELWNGDSFHVPILTLLFYGIYHPINEIKNLPGGLEAHRCRM
uniref:Ubiquitin-like protease family profile domain-containing protein n=1 Tax=Setaria italica TaxID=4555 RepID=K3ZE82_SETIT